MIRKYTKKASHRTMRNKRLSGGRGGAGGLGGASVGHGDGGFGAGRADIGSVDNKAFTTGASQVLYQLTGRTPGLSSGGKRNTHNRRTRRNKRN